ncbi:glycosyl transferase, group 1 [Psychromonas ingrahamii 37]|uniref:Glycosyl transferase, group 1 n=1 Tax=Psychromonas ingrahamii (strain DSM 17664 / CCUG 51855 / 37) TaxID=357804 RepID=A1SS49_PSYIN|nr:glycosyltransferase family 4 protein [Psychromonas ingrahamii]ABM02314.1 glycosyl transferase, group 1 [Psychromonas ingrahamii 37]
MVNICLVAHFAYGALTGGSQGAVGGVERQTSLMAKWLVAKGHKVSLLTWAEGGDDDEVIDGVQVIKICRRDSGLPGIRFFHPRWTGLISAMKRANADVYYQNCGEYITGQVAMWCKENNKKFLYSVASDADADPRFPVMHTLRERWLYKYGLLNADKVIVQTKTQMKLLKKGFDLDSSIMPMPCLGPDQTQYQPLEWNTDKATILWAARIHECKRLELFLQVATELPEYNFVVAGSSGKEDAYSQGLMDKMKQLENVTYLGMVARADMPALYRASTVFCCSSEYEGFPNTFLEAWSQGLPVVSTFDPDHLIQERKLGISATNKDELVLGISEICTNRELWQLHSSNARRYYQENHSVDKVMERFEKIFINLVR